MSSSLKQLIFVSTQAHALITRPLLRTHGVITITVDHAFLRSCFVHCVPQILKAHPNKAMSEIYGMEHFLRLFGEMYN